MHGIQQHSKTALIGSCRIEKNTSSPECLASTLRTEKFQRTDFV